MQSSSSPPNQKLLPTPLKDTQSFAPAQTQKSPDWKEKSITFVKGFCFADHCLSAFLLLLSQMSTMLQKKSCGRPCPKFWQVWLSLGSNPRMVSILQEGYNLPFKMRPPLSPLVASGYANPHKNKCLKEAVQSLIQKKAVEKVMVQSSLAFYNRLFLVAEPLNCWRPILDLSTLNVFLKVDTVKMETPETIRLSLQQGELVTSLDFSDVYFHIPISQGSFSGSTYMEKPINSHLYPLA